MYDMYRIILRAILLTSVGLNQTSTQFIGVFNFLPPRCHATSREQDTNSAVGNWVSLFVHVRMCKLLKVLVLASFWFAIKFAFLYPVLITKHQYFFFFRLFCILSPNSSKMSPALALIWAGISEWKCHGLLSFVFGRSLSIHYKFVSHLWLMLVQQASISTLSVLIALKWHGIYYVTNGIR